MVDERCSPAPLPLRRQNLLQHLNSPLKKEVMTEKDFAKTQPYLFGENFGQKAKEKLDAVEALRKVVYQPFSKEKQNFQGGYPRKQFRAKGVTALAMENIGGRVEETQVQRNHRQASLD